jgi:GST-like protein
LRHGGGDPIESFPEEETAMIDLHYWPTPNGWKITIMLEETGLPYRVVPVNIGRGEQFRPEFLAISPNTRMPAIVDDDPPGGGAPISIFESGAILLYLGDKTGKFLPKDLRGRYEVTQWLMWQMGGLGPMAGQAHHFRQYAPEKIAYGIDRYTKEVNRLYGVMNKRLADREFLAGDYSIADMAAYPWVVPYKNQGQDLKEFPNLERWFETLKARPAVQRGLDVGKELRNTAPMDEEAKKILFGQTAKSVEQK